MSTHFKIIDEELYDGILWILSNSSAEYQKKCDDDFRKVLNACLKEYMALVKDVTIDILFYAKVVNNCDYMNRIVRSYLQGRHSTAFTQLKNILKSNVALYTTEVQRGELFYRMRSFEKRKGLSRKDLFHIPINKKRVIKTQRYSAPGYPCLYLGKSIYGCWEEMHRPNTETTLISCFKCQGNGGTRPCVSCVSEIYKLVNPYQNIGGLNGVIDHYAPLVFQYVGNE